MFQPSFLQGHFGADVQLVDQVVRNLTRGGLNGYSAGKTRSTLNTPPSYGVDAGPISIAFQCNKSSPHGPAVAKSVGFASKSDSSYHEEISLALISTAQREVNGQKVWRLERKIS